MKVWKIYLIIKYFVWNFSSLKHSVWIDFSVCIQLYFQNKLSDKSKYFALNKYSDSVRNFVWN